VSLARNQNQHVSHVRPIFSLLVVCYSFHQFSITAASEKPETVPIIFVEADGTEREVQAEIGQSLLEVAHSNNVELEGKFYNKRMNESCGTKSYETHTILFPTFISLSLYLGACGGELACSTCHLIFPQDIYDTLDPMEDDEEDMLDLAFELTETYVLCWNVMYYVAVLS